MKLLVLCTACCLYFTIVGAKKQLRKQNNVLADYSQEDNTLDEEIEDNKHPAAPENLDNCWPGRQQAYAKLKEQTDALKALNDKYASVLQNLDSVAKKEELDQIMHDDMVKTRAAAHRAIHNAYENANNIPAGINLGAYSIMRMNHSILFFYRMKLRNDTKFQIMRLHSNLTKLVLYIDFNLNDLHLRGDYERAIFDLDPSALYYQPTYGALDLLLKNVQYHVQGHYRIVQGKLYVEHIQSQMFAKDILMNYFNMSMCEDSVPVDPQAIQEFLERLKADLNSWMKDYLNDYLIFIDHIKEVNTESEAAKYDVEKGLKSNAFIDRIVEASKQRIKSLNPSCISVATPPFKLTCVNGLTIYMHDGVLRGMDTFYRQGMATSYNNGTITYAQADIGFSSLMLEYQYTAHVNVGVPPLTGMFYLNADDLTFKLAVASTPVVPHRRQIFGIDYDATFEFVRQKRPLTLVIEGPASRKISNIRPLLEDEIISLMVNTVLYHVKRLSTLNSCDVGLTCVENTTVNDVTTANSTKPDFMAYRNDSIELEIPKDESEQAKRLKIHYYEQIKIKEDLISNLRKALRNKSVKKSDDKPKRSLKRKVQKELDEKKADKEHEKRTGQKRKIKADDSSSVSHS